MRSFLDWTNWGTFILEDSAMKSWLTKNRGISKNSKPELATGMLLFVFVRAHHPSSNRLL
ncbi:hypothetical protein WN943_020463 [Citrus x changshan-huyou]